ncbi:hypothetical protein CHUAL_006827 [Chamberlinius hualienensis]
MLYMRHALLLVCFLTSLTWAKKKEKGDGAIRIVVRGPPLPILLQSLSGFLMNQYIRSFSGPSSAGYMQSRSDHYNPFAIGGYNVHNSGYNNYSPKRTGYHFSHGLDVLSKLIFGSNPATFDRYKSHGTGTYAANPGLLGGSRSSNLSEFRLGRKQGTVEK